MEPTVDTNPDVLSVADRGGVLQVLSAIWGGITGLAPHVLHHVGPLAGAAVLAGAGGRWLFYGIGLAASYPMLRRLYRRFSSWIAPVIAIVVFSVLYAVSSFVIGPLITGGSDEAAAGTTVTTVHSHNHG